MVANVDGQANQDAERVKELLVQQVTGTVRWQESVEWIGAQGVTSALEIGNGTVIKGLIRRINKELDVTPIGTPDDIAGVEL